MMLNDREKLELLRRGLNREAFMLCMSVCAALAYFAGIAIVTGPVLVGMAAFWLGQVHGSVTMLRAHRRKTTIGDRDAR
jgi:Flp pilus assembly protein TadB